MALTFADTHNMIAFLTKLDASEDRRKVIITKDMVQQALRFDDAESIDCLPNEEIFAELARMGYEKPSTKTAWNKFSSSMASAVICLATGRKFNFSKYIFDSLVRNVDSSSKFYVYTRFLQLMINDQVGDLSSHTTKYTSPALTQKVFANMRRVGKGFFEVDNPLYEGMLVPQQVHNDVADDVADEVRKEEKVESFWVKKIEEGGIAELDADEDVTLEEVTAKITKDVDIQGRLEESQAQVYHFDLEHAQKVLSMQDDEAKPAELKEVIEVVTTAKLMTEVVIAATTTITAASMPKASAARRRKGVVIRDQEEIATPSVIMHSEPKSKDKGKGILVEEPKPLKKQAHIEQDEAYARELKAELNANINWNEVIEQKYFNSIVAFLEKGEEELEEEASKQSKRKSETSEEKTVKKHKLDEEVEELKTHLQIIPNDEDDVYTETTPLALKVPVVDYQIHTENNKPTTRS
nr:hypothetical protein [Tanacetum cinerariifolium]